MATFEGLHNIMENEWISDAINYERHHDMFMRRLNRKNKIKMYLIL